MAKIHLTLSTFPNVTLTMWCVPWRAYRIIHAVYCANCEYRLETNMGEGVLGHLHSLNQIFTYAHIIQWFRDMRINWRMRTWSL